MADLNISAWGQWLVLAFIPSWSPEDKSPGGKDPTTASSSTGVLFTTLVPVLAIAALQFLGFFVLRRTNQHIYAPRTILDVVDDHQRPSLIRSRSWFDWIVDFLALRDESLLEQQSLDAYLFLRFLKMVVLICFVGMCLTWPILLPINITGGSRLEELDRLTIGNIQDPRRYYAHLTIAIVFLTFVMFTITRETLYYINLRQAYLLTPWNASRISSRTVLFTSIPERQLDESSLRQVFESVKRVWIVQDCSKIKRLTEKRLRYTKKLEYALVNATTRFVKDYQKNNRGSSHDGNGQDERPTLRKNLLDTKQDAIAVYSRRLVETNTQLDLAQTQAVHGNTKHVGGAFIEFESISAAQTAFQTTLHQNPLVMTPRSIATIPSGVIWENIGIPAWQMLVRGILATTFMLALVLFWSIPTSFIGILSNVEQLSDDITWLHWIKNLPRPVLDAVQGLLPSLLLSTLVSYVPIVCRYVAYLSGEVTKADIELKTQEWYFIFQVIQVFLVTTFASGATAVTSGLIENPKKAPELLAKKLPKASNFYLSYFIIYGLGQSTKNLLNWSGLFFDKFLSLFDKTPRAKYERYTTLSGTGWGSWYPKFTNLAIIAISYSCIAPLTLGFACLAFCCLYLVFRYNLFYVLQTSIDTQGRAYSKALQQLTVGMYTAELCLIGLFSISVKRHNSSSGPLVVMIIFTALTAVYHYTMHKWLDDLTKTLPRTLVRQQEQLQGGVEERTRGEDEPLLGRRPGNRPPGLKGLFLKFFEPQRYASFTSNLALLTRTNLAESVPPIQGTNIENAYYGPEMAAKQPTIWIAKDSLGRSDDLMKKLPGEFHVTNHRAWVDERAKVHFQKDQLRDIPIWKENLYY